MNIPCILWPLIAGVVGAILGYLLGKMAGGDDNSSQKIDNSELDALRAKNTKLETDLAACRNRVSSVNAGTGSIAMAASAVAFDAGAAKAAFGKKIVQDDLKIVEGIGPKIEGLFHAAGIRTWTQLGECNFDTCKKILNDAGDRYKMHNPATWPDQAKMAAEGKFAELKDWQDKLDGGK